MDFATTDLVFAIGHHLLIFALAGVLAFEIAVLRAGLTARDIGRLGRVDLWYGLLAAAIVIVGFSRVIFAAKGWAYYSANVFFWTKIATFALVGILSIWPTMAIMGWRRTLKREPAFLPGQPSIARIRRFLWAEALLFIPILACAAAMARGYGELAA